MFTDVRYEIFRKIDFASTFYLLIGDSYINALDRIKFILCLVMGYFIIFLKSSISVSKYFLSASVKLLSSLINLTDRFR